MPATPEYKRQRLALLRARGLCAWCQGKSPRFIYCRSCRERKNAKARETWPARRAAA